MGGSELDDEVFWKLTSHKRFTTKSCYLALECDVFGPNYKWLWKAKIPLKIQIFMWQVMQNAILTRDNMRKRKWAGNPLCSFCDQLETKSHLFFKCASAKVVWGCIGSVLHTNSYPSSIWQCFAWFYAFWPGGAKFYALIMSAVCWAIWTTRNKITFEGYKLRSPISIVFTVCSFLKYWAGMYKAEDKMAICMGADYLIQKTMVVARQDGTSSSTTRASGCLLITDT